MHYSLQDVRQKVSASPLCAYNIYYYHSIPPNTPLFTKKMPSQTERRGFSLFTIPTLCCYCLLAFTTNATKVNAFVISPSQVAPCPTLHNNHSSLQLKASKSPNSNDPERQQLTHADIEWRLIAPEGTSRLDRWKIKLGAFVIRADRKIRRSPPPPLLCPRGGQALLEAYYKGMRAPDRVHVSLTHAIVTAVISLIF